jgi:hypothetical protein
MWIVNTYLTTMVNYKDRFTQLKINICPSIKFLIFFSISKFEITKLVQILSVKLLVCYYLLFRFYFIF